jgi:hypothetical protein
MIPLGTLHRLGRRIGRTMLASTTAALLLLCAMMSPGHALGRPQPPWHIESFCHRGAPSAHRCLVRARQGILVFQLAELASAPSVSWSNGVAVLASGTDKASRQLRFFVPPQKLSEPFTQVRAYDIAQQRVALYSDGQLRVRAMFAGDTDTNRRDLAVLPLPSNIVADTLQVSFEGLTLHASWRDRDGRSQQRTLPARN